MHPASGTSSPLLPPTLVPPPPRPSPPDTPAVFCPVADCRVRREHLGSGAPPSPTHPHLLYSVPFPIAGSDENTFVREQSIPHTPDGHLQKPTRQIPTPLQL